MAKKPSSVLNTSVPGVPDNEETKRKYRVGDAVKTVRDVLAEDGKKIEIPKGTVGKIDMFLGKTIHGPKYVVRLKGDTEFAHNYWQDELEPA